MMAASFSAALIVFYCNNSPLSKKVMMQGQPTTLQSASKNKATSRPAAPRASVKARILVRMHRSEGFELRQSEIATT
jgi:hypothetical protein